MSTLIANPQFKLYAICAVILSFQMLLLGAMTAAKRANRQGYMNPEDKTVSKKDATLVEGTEHPDVARVIRAHRNLLESLPLFYALGLLCVLVEVAPLGAQICFGAFTGARVIHSIVYLKALQPWRTMFFAIGALSLIGMMVQIVIAVVA